MTEKMKIIDIPLTPEVQQAEHRAGIEHIHHRAEDAEHKDLVLLGPTEPAAAGGKICHLLLLPVENLRDFDTREIL